MEKAPKVIAKSSDDDLRHLEGTNPPSESKTPFEQAGNTQNIDPDEVIFQGNEAVVLKIDGHQGEAAASNLKLARDGHTVLIPQASDDPNDPLNWSWSKKHIQLFLMGLGAASCDFAISVGVPAELPQGAYWNISPLTVNSSVNLAVILNGVAGILWIPPSYFWGRAPVLFWSTLASFLLTLGCCLCKDWTTFYALRALQAIFLTPCTTIALSYIKDIFFFHEHARKIGIWIACFFLAPYFGPMLGNFMIAGTGNWRVPFWVSLGPAGLNLLFVVLFADESWYRRDIPISQQPDRGQRLMRVTGVWQIRNHSYFVRILPGLDRLRAVIVKPVMIPIVLYYCMNFMWAVGINIGSAILLQTPRKEGGYGFSQKAVGFVYFTPIVGVLLGETFGHFFNDFLANRYARRHAGIFRPEARLPANVLGAIFMIPGLILVGYALEKHLHWVAVIFGWGLFVFGVMIASVAIMAYALDCYPNGSGEVSAYVNFGRVVGGFAVGYFLEDWGLRVGYAEAFGVQAAVVAAALIVLGILMQYGERLRAQGGPLRFVGSS